MTKTNLEVFHMCLFTWFTENVDWQIASDITSCRNNPSKNFHPGSLDQGISHVSWRLINENLNTSCVTEKGPWELGWKRGSLCVCRFILSLAERKPHVGVPWEALWVLSIIWPCVTAEAGNKAEWKDLAPVELPL